MGVKSNANDSIDLRVFIPSISIIIGLMLPIYYFTSPPFGIEAASDAAAEWALTYGQFHWGLTPWAFYCLPAIPIAYSMYVRKQPGIRLSVAARGVLGRHSDGWGGALLDSIVVFGIVGGVGTRKLSGYQEPKRSTRLIWAFLIAGVGIVLIQMGGLRPVQTSTIVVALPMIPVLGVLAWSLMRWLKEDFGEKAQEPHLVYDEEVEPSK